MSDYGEDFEDDYGEEWLYVEDEYMQADDLAEHAVASPPPATYDEDQLDEWDRFDYFNDLEYDFEGYDDANFVPHNGETGQPKIGQKRKRGAAAGHSNKKQRLSNGEGKPERDVAWLTNAPIIWRAQADRGAKPRPLPENVQSYAILKDWREKVAEGPDWVQKPLRSSAEARVPPKELEAVVSNPHVDEDEQEWEDDQDFPEEEENEDEEETSIDPTALMAALQSRLAAAGGPLSGMDPQQLLQFALRMANNQDAGDDIAGEMADEMLNQGEDEEDEEAEASLLSWVAQQRNGSKTDTPVSSQAKRTTDETVNEANVEEDTTSRVKQKSNNLEVKQTSRKRKADSPTDGAASPKKRATKPSEALPAASSANSTPAATRRSRRIQR